MTEPVTEQQTETEQNVKAPAKPMAWPMPMPFGMFPGMHPAMFPPMFGKMHPLMQAQMNIPPHVIPAVPRIKKLDCYQMNLDQQLGTGFSSVVYRAIDTRNEQEVCIKAVDYVGLGANHKNMVITEIAIMKDSDCPNILKCSDVLQSKQFCYIVTELCNEGDLFKKIKNQGAMSEQKAVEYMKGVANGLLSLKKKGVIHRDIKPSNVLLKNNVPKIADFGFAVYENKLSQDIITNLGSPIYMAPEVLFDNKYSYASDVFAFGVAFYELLHLVTPWECDKQEELRARIANDEPVKFKQGLSEKVVKIIGGCLMKDVSKRSTIQQVVEILNS